MNRFIFLLLVLSADVNAALINRGVDNLGNQLIYDDALDITWYDYSSHNTWQGQLDWAENLSVTFRGTVFDDWRLPSADPSCANSFNCVSSEMANLYYNSLNNLADLNSQTGSPSHIPLKTDFIDGVTGKTEAFKNLLDSYYWSSTESDLREKAWFFLFNYGYQFEGNKLSTIYAIAVRDGDVGLTTSVMEPSIISLIALFTFALLYRQRANMEEDRATYATLLPH